MDSLCNFTYRTCVNDEQLFVAPEILKFMSLNLLPLYVCSFHGAKMGILVRTTTHILRHQNNSWYIVRWFKNCYVKQFMNKQNAKNKHNWRSPWCRQDKEVVVGDGGSRRRQMETTRTSPLRQSGGTKPTGKVKRARPWHGRLPR